MSLMPPACPAIPCPKRMDAKAFTLAETLFAMAIVSFTLLSIIGLIPSSLSELNDSERRAAEARILQSLTADYELKPWADVQGMTSSDVYYFDASGVRLRGRTDDTHYAAQVSAMQPRSSSGNAAGELTLPGEGSASTYLCRLRVAITDRPRDPMAFTADDKRNLAREYALILANREPDLPPP